ncbi:hypothetical protein KAR91_57535 [Candidatus Pacearchaeota archaeon]|nr:hypothetical protein [Candidatus Pacearchaeota archaeon]
MTCCSDSFQGKECMCSKKTSEQRGVMCECQDSNGDICGKIMTSQEIKQDGMCYFCADNVCVEMTNNINHKWYHRENT